MRFSFAQVWQYTVLLILLFAISAVSVGSTIGHLPDWGVPIESQRQIAWVLIATSLGFMLIAGAFGIWTIRQSVELATRQRVGRFVDAMDYLSDGALVVDRRGRVIGSNPSARRLGRFGQARNPLLAEAFPCFSAEDIAVLLAGGEPREIEKPLREGDVTRTLRFRSQPSEGDTLVLISDVTRLYAEHAQKRHVARLQLLGHLAGGVTYDLNRLLCGISGHASVIGRLPPGSLEVERAARALAADVERGVFIASRLGQLVLPPDVTTSVRFLQHHLETAAEVLRQGLSHDWEVVIQAVPVAPVALAGSQVEQMAVNLGYLAADAALLPGRLVLRVAPPPASEASSTPSVAGCLVISTAGPGEPAEGDAALWRADTESHGIIESVVASLLEGAGGALVKLRTPTAIAFRLSLPAAALPTEAAPADDLPAEMRDYLARWRVLLAVPPHQRARLVNPLAGLGLVPEAVDDVISVLARIQSEQAYDGMVLDKSVLKHEAEGLLRAILKLSPRTAIVVLTGNPDAEPADLRSEIVFMPGDSAVSRVASAMVEARAAATRRTARSRQAFV
jgi:PAS domain-containing protein